MSLNTAIVMYIVLESFYEKKDNSYSCKECQMFFDGQVVNQDVMLRTEAKAFTNLSHVPSHIKSINVSRSSAWWQETCTQKAKIILLLLLLLFLIPQVV